MNMRLYKQIIIALIVVVAIVSFSTAEAAGRYVVVIDPAHGGSDNGVKLTGKIYEKDVTLAIAKQIKRDLGKVRDIQVLLTRSKDSDVSPSVRILSARKAKADLVISLHVNAGFGVGSSGYEVYFLGFKNKPSKKGDSEEIVSDMVRNKYLNEGVRFAQIALKNIEPIFPRKGRGLRDAANPTLKNLTIPAVVIELGFATNIQDRKNLANKEIQAQVATALSTSIKDYFSTSGAQ